MTYYGTHLEPDLVARFDATPGLIPVTGEDAYVMRPSYTDHEGRLNCHYIHSENKDRLQLKYWYCDQKRIMVGLAHFGSAVQGPPQHGHGGAMATTLDDTVGVCGNMAFRHQRKDYVVLVQKIEVSFRKSIPLRQTYFVEAKIEKEEERKFQVTGQLFGRAMPLQGTELSWSDWNDGQRVVYASIVGTLAKVPLDKIGELKTRAKF